jgi:uncharacterized membrane protein YfcA
VPLLLLWRGYEEREATGTSLAAIVIIAALAAAAQGLHGNVSVLKATIVGAPALGGVVAGTALQQRIPEWWIAAIFVPLLLASAAILVF